MALKPQKLIAMAITWQARLSRKIVLLLTASAKVRSSSRMSGRHRKRRPRTSREWLENQPRQAQPQREDRSVIEQWSERNLRDLEADVESRRVALRAFHQRQHQLAAASAKQPILLVFDRPMSLAGVWLLRMDSIRQPGHRNKAAKLFPEGFVISCWCEL